MLADIATGNTDLADVLFLVAAVAAGVATVVRMLARTNVDGALVAAAVALVAIGWLAL